MALNKALKLVNPIGMDSKRIDDKMKEKKGAFSVSLTLQKVDAVEKVYGKDFNLSKFLDALLDEYLEDRKKAKGSVG